LSYTDRTSNNRPGENESESESESATNLLANTAILRSGGIIVGNLKTKTKTKQEVVSIIEQQPGEGRSQSDSAVRPARVNGLEFTRRSSGPDAIESACGYKQNRNTGKKSRVSDDHRYERAELQARRHRVCRSLLLSTLFISGTVLLKHSN